MRVVISQNHLSLNERLVREANKLTKGFNNQRYSRIENIENILLKNNISVENKKRILIEKLHDAILRTLSIDKKKFIKKTFDSLKKRVHNIRRIVTKLRSINYYLETVFLEELKLSKVRLKDKSSNLKQQNNLAKDELEALEYTAYKLIGEVVMLDKRLLKEYSKKEKSIARRESLEVKDLSLILKKESQFLEHLEAKLPPPKSMEITLIKEPMFTHWVARIFALLLHLEQLSHKEHMIFSKLNKNKSAKIKISKKIIHLIREKSKLLKIMQEKAIVMKKFRTDSELKKELHNLTTIIRL